ncbi:OmpA family protein [Deminuibacter soli]|uniref:OmpA family protein n=1 Tax=Deminuibacter soli TaxID=2291815 RepID=A0A3E1NH23_9BACT|nr:OmpA family protein [Deminuibacter soli]RFM27256.1 OmpA family protein [Deminuibacter soli]
MATHSFEEQDDRGIVTRLVRPGIISFIICTLLVLIARGCAFHAGADTTAAFEPVSGEAHEATTEHTEAAEPEAPATSRESIKVQLPGNIELNAYKGGIEDQLVRFLNDNTAVAGKDVWFDFDNLNFATNSAVITSESNEQVKNIAAIVKAYPKLKIKIGGYTDKTGDSTANLKLSQQRADATLAALKAENVSPAQLLGAEGYGSQFAKAAANAPDEEKKKDRRISVGVREK